MEVLQPVVGDDGSSLAGSEARQHAVELGIELGRQEHRLRQHRPPGPAVWPCRTCQPADAAQVEPVCTLALIGDHRRLPGLADGPAAEIQQTPGETGTLVGQQQQQKPEQRLAESGRVARFYNGPEGSSTSHP